MIFAMDGNNSLKRVHLREKLAIVLDGQSTVGPSKERRDPREGGGDYFLSRAEVDTHVFVEDNDEPPPTETSPLPAPTVSSHTHEHTPSIDPPPIATPPAHSFSPGDAPPGDEENPCEERWHNMQDKHTKSMWEVFDETGIFLSICRHSFVLLIVDMVKSGEL
jgi:hypothetical protein